MSFSLTLQSLLNNHARVSEDCNQLDSAFMKFTKGLSLSVSIRTFRGLSVLGAILVSTLTQTVGAQVYGRPTSEGQENFFCGLLADEEYECIRL